MTNDSVRSPANAGSGYSPSGLSRPSASQAEPSIPNAERRQIVAFLTWWAKDHAAQAEKTLDYDKEIEFSIRAEALADAARDILDFGDVRHAASGMEARQGGDVKLAPSSDDSPASEAGDAPTVEVRP